MKNNTATITWDLARKAMNNGKWVRHTFFMPEEKITITGNLILFEDGYTCFLEDFKRFRFRNSESTKAWTESGWEVVNAPENLKKCSHCGVYTTKPQDHCYANPNNQRNA